jgi:hypothetical protein
LAAGFVLFVLLPDSRFRFGVGLRPAFYPTGIYAFMDRSVPAQPIFNGLIVGLALGSGTGGTMTAAAGDTQLSAPNVLVLDGATLARDWGLTPGACWRSIAP